MGDFVCNTVLRDFEHQSYNVYTNIDGPTLNWIYVNYIELYELNFDTILRSFVRFLA